MRLQPFAVGRDARIAVVMGAAVCNAHIAVTAAPVPAAYVYSTDFVAAYIQTIQDKVLQMRVVDFGIEVNAATGIGQPTSPHEIQTPQFYAINVVCVKAITIIATDNCSAFAI
ncbi:hypothetical protein [Hymenobacter jejuensis]|uniref:hypothetical protein n=1 Tax=Hymenobacter jejuensis TaxID=2502781 RepID=UPI0013FD07AA|nr:hypothetical protein [Hymenobacter jejuensis]